MQHSIYRTYKGIIETLPSNGIFVFGSNTQGRHGKGAALIARERFGAIYGQSYGFQGRSYAIITKDISKKPYRAMSKAYIIGKIIDLYTIANDAIHLDFYIAYQGEGINLNGYTPQEMAHMFLNAGKIPLNIIFEEKFYNIIQLI